MANLTTTVKKRRKTGCITCRIRRVKCDEEHPECKRCKSTGRKCDGYSTIPFSRRELAVASKTTSKNTNSGWVTLQSTPLTRLVADPTFSNVVEKRYFQFFRQNTVASTNSLVDSRFWDRLLLQACHSEPAVKHAVLAMTSWHQHIRSHSNPDADASIDAQHRLFATRQYHLALQHTQALIAANDPSNIERVLIACIVCIGFEAVRGSFGASQRHMDSGRAIARLYRSGDNHRQLHNSRSSGSSSSSSHSSSSDLDEITDAFARLDVACLTFSDSSAPNNYTLADFHASGPILQPWAFADTSEAQTSLVDLLRWLLLLERAQFNAMQTGPACEAARLAHEREICAAAFAEWKLHFDVLLARQQQQKRNAAAVAATTIASTASTASTAAPTTGYAIPNDNNTTTTNELVALNLQQWHALARVMLAKTLEGPETEYDACMAEFTEAVEVAEAIVQGLRTSDSSSSTGGGSSFSYDFGYASSVFYAAERCRDPVLRRRAVRVLADLPRQEGLWASVAAAAIVQRWIEIEEAGLEDVRTAADVPESHRVQMICDITVVVQEGYAKVAFLLVDGRKEWRFVQWLGPEKCEMVGMMKASSPGLYFTEDRLPT